MGHSGGESTSQFLAYGVHLNHYLENTKSTSTMNGSSSQFFNKEYQNQEQFQNQGINIEEDEYINVLESKENSLPQCSQEQIKTKFKLNCPCLDSHQLAYIMVCNESSQKTSEPYAEKYYLCSPRNKGEQRPNGYEQSENAMPSDDRPGTEICSIGDNSSEAMGGGTTDTRL